MYVVAAVDLEGYVDGMMVYDGFMRKWWGMVVGLGCGSAPRSKSFFRFFLAFSLSFRVARPARRCFPWALARPAPFGCRALPRSAGAAPGAPRAAFPSSSALRPWPYFAVCLFPCLSGFARPLGAMARLRCAVRLLGRGVGWGRSGSVGVARSIPVRRDAAAGWCVRGGGVLKLHTMPSRCPHTRKAAAAAGGERALLAPRSARIRALRSPLRGAPSPFRPPCFRRRIAYPHTFPSFQNTTSAPALRSPLTR